MELATVASARFSTEGLAPADLADAWRAEVSDLFELGRPLGTNGVPFHASIETYQLPSLLLSRARLGAQSYRRDRRRIRDGCDHFVLACYQRGAWRGEGTGVAPAPLLIVDLAQPLACETTDADVTSVVVPRGTIEHRLPHLDTLHGGAPTGGLPAILVDFIGVLSHHAAAITRVSGEDLSQSITDMVAACLSADREALERARPAVETMLLGRAKRLIDADLPRSHVDIAQLCAALGTSRRTLYRLFEPYGGVQHYIIGRRLDRVRARLADAFETRRIADVAAEFGFSRSDHFARAFRQRFGYSARDARQGPAHQRPASDALAGSSASGIGFAQWIRTLEAW